MAHVTISSDDPRSIKALEIAAGAGQWLRCRTHDGRTVFGVPSQSREGVYYLVDGERCTCHDFKHNGLSRPRLGATGLHAPCKHLLAVRLYCELVRAQNARPLDRRRRRLRVVPPA